MSKTKLLTLSPGSRYLVPIGAVATAGLIGANMLCPMSSNDAMAANLPVSLTKSLASEIELSIGGEGMGVLTPGESAVDSTVVNRTLTIGLTNSSGYSVQLSAEHAALQGESDSKHQIPGITAASTLSQMPTNTWGYSIDGTNYHAPSTEATTAYRSNSLDIGTKETKTHTLRFAAKVDADTPADTYSNTVYVSVVSEPRQVATFAGLTMQQVTPTICKQAAIHETAYLRDERDNNYYWITKLKDGNCWMSQNLALDLVQGKDINKSTAEGGSSLVSNASANSYTPEDSTFTIEDGERFDSKYGANNKAYSWNEGKWVMIKPLGAYNVILDFHSYSLSEWNNVAALEELGVPIDTEDERSALTSLGFLADVSGVDWTVTTDPNFTSSSSYTVGNKSCNKTPGWSIATDEVCGKVYDSHYLVGNYYQWAAAVALTPDQVVEVSDVQIVSSNICPKGWQMPTVLPITENGTYSNMMSGYGNLVTGYNTGVTLPYADNATNNAADSPFFMPRAGYAGSGGIRALGRFSNTWASYTRNNDSAMRLGFNQSGVYAVNNVARSMGHAVRCLVLVPEETTAE